MALVEPAASDPPKQRSKRAKTLSAAELERVRELYLAGRTTAELGREFGVDRQTVQRRLRSMGVRMRGSSLTPGELTRAQVLYASGQSAREVAEALGCGENAVRNALIRSGVQMRNTQGRPRSV